MIFGALERRFGATGQALIRDSQVNARTIGKFFVWTFQNPLKSLFGTRKFLLLELFQALFVSS
ncbi:MAG: hypothetical protein WBD23_00130 [Candidatus Acidiferrales bacterium]